MRKPTKTAGAYVKVLVPVKDNKKNKKHESKESWRKEIGEHLI